MLDIQALFTRYLGPLADGLRFTLLVFVGAVIIATVIGLVVGTARLSPYRTIRYLAVGFVETFRGTSALVQLFWVFYALPVLLGISFPKLMAAWIVIGFNQGAYLAEVVRGAIQSVPAGQLDASIAINLSPLTRWRRIMLPQALPVIIPPYTNLVITILKETAIVSLIGIADLTFVANQLRTEHGHTTWLFTGICAAYLVTALGLARVGRSLEHVFDIHRRPRSGRRGVAGSEARSR